MIERGGNVRCRCRGTATSSCTAALLALAFAGCGPAGEDRAGEDRAAATPPALSGIRYLAEGDAGDGFARALEPRRFEFPSDHASHPRFRTEWWYFTGNVFDRRERHYGFELTIFRIALTPEPVPSASALASHQVWMANLAVTDTATRRFEAAERLSRGAAGIAGAFASGTAAGDPLTIRVEDWSAEFAGDSITLAAANDGFGIELALTGLDRIVYQGDGGLDPKGPEPGNASYYYSAPRLQVTGRLHAGGEAPVAVEGTAWMDREWSTSALSPDLAGWDWFALQLGDGRDLMFYRLRTNDGGTGPYSGGSIVDAAGNATRLDAGDVVLAATREWRSPATRVRYPVAWRLDVPEHALELEIKPRLDAQEIDLAVRYWEGAVEVSGRANGRRIDGVGYLELAGY